MVTSRQNRLALRCNAAVAGASGVAVGFLFMHPTSTNSADKPAALARLEEQGASEDAHSLDDGHWHAANDVIRDADPFDGPAVDTPCGPVQVRIYETENRLVRAEALDYPRTTAVDRPDPQRGRDPHAHRMDAAGGERRHQHCLRRHPSLAYKKSLQAALDDADL